MAKADLELSQSHKEVNPPQRSSSNVAFRILEDLNHATIKLSILEKGEVFEAAKAFFR